MTWSQTETLRLKLKYNQNYTIGSMPLHNLDNITSLSYHEQAFDFDQDCINIQTYHKHKQMAPVHYVINLLMWLWTLNRQTGILMCITLIFLKLSDKFYYIQAAEIIKPKMLSKRITFSHQINTNFRNFFNFQNIKWNQKTNLFRVHT